MPRSAATQPARLSNLEVAALSQVVRQAPDAFIEELAGLVAIDSGTPDIAGVDRVGAVLADRLERLGASVQLRHDGAAGHTVVARFHGGRPGRRLLVSAHLDTVFGPGEAAARPLVIRDGRAYGPGAADMKGGLLLLVHALEAIRGIAGVPVPAGELVVVASPDEESGSRVGSIALREAAARAEIGLVLEPARPTGDLISARKGMVQGRLRFAGRAAHAGVEPERGRSAVLAASHATVALHALTGMGDGVTCTVGTIRGGTRPNVVPDEATLEFDLRASTPEGLAAAEEAIARLCAAPAVPDVIIEMELLGRFPPMPRTAQVDAVLELAVAVGASLGLTFGSVATGGASDANTIAQMGKPVIDGLGPVGGGLHSIDEHVVVGAIGERTALLAGLLLVLGRSRPPAVGNPTTTRD